MKIGTINFTAVEHGLERIIETFPGDYRNLMELLRDQLYLDSFGECGGMGRCATCIIRVTGLKGNSITRGRNEPSTLSKFGYSASDLRLSCQILLSSDLEGATIEIFK